MNHHTLTILLTLTLSFAHAGEVSVVRLPDGAIQPRTAADKDGTTHIVFLQGNPQACQVKLATLGSDGVLGTPLSVSTPTSQAVGMGTVRGPSLALGLDGVRHLLWSGKMGTASDGKGCALFFASVDASGKASEPRDMLGTTTALDGGAATAADAKGNVWLVWHALPKGKDGEAARRVFVRHSTDNAMTFSEPWFIKGEDFGVCGCCGLAAGLDATGALHVLYRTAEKAKQRGARVIRLPLNPTAQSVPVLLGKDGWNIAACPMTTAQLSPIGDTLSASWVKEFKLQFLGKGLEALNAKSKSSKAMQNHPRLVRNARGETLSLWTENAMWGKGGELVWQVVSSDGKALGSEERQRLPVWTYGASAVLADGRFAVIY